MFDRRFIHYYHVVKHKLLQLEPYQGGLQLRFTVHSNENYPIASQMVRSIIGAGVPAFIEMYVTGKLLVEGPKLFSFEARECEALENFDLSLPAHEYVQPFPTLMIQMPEDYRKNRIVPYEGGSHYPKDIIIHHDPALARVMILVRLSSMEVLSRNLRLLPIDGTLEHSWSITQHQYEGADATLSVNQDELQLGNRLSRLALSACLMLMTYGTKRVGPDNPSLAARLEKHLQKAQKEANQDRIKEASYDLRVLPVRYSFAQH